MCSGYSAAEKRLLLQRYVEAFKEGKTSQDQLERILQVRARVRGFRVQGASCRCMCVRCASASHVEGCACVCERERGKRERQEGL